MRRTSLLLPFVLALLAASAVAGTKVVPTTTLAAETENNTSAANSFKSQPNGNLGTGNISKVPLRSLLYPGASSKIYVHWMPWFGPTNHMNVGYDSSDPAQVARQVEDMVSRGIDGAIVDWYGPESTHHNAATVALRDASTVRNNFEFAITEDVGALNKCASTAGCDVTQKLISDLTYAWNTFEQSAAYMRFNGRPVVFFFGVEKYAIDWVRAKANVPGNPIFIFRNSGAFTKTSTGGGFAWVTISTTDRNNVGLSYLDNFYATGLKYPALLTYGSSWKGFNDTLAGWSQNRIMNQNCGQTWLATWAEAGRFYSASQQLYALQVASWNDYEEGTEIETGIDNCVSISGAMSGTTLMWAVTGSESTIDHYTVFVSLDGQNLMALAELPASARSLNLGSFGFSPAQYTMYVKSVGKATLRNQMTGPIRFSIANQPPTIALVVTPATGIAPVTVSASTEGSADADGEIVSTTVDFGDGTVMSGASNSHAYDTPGTYIVTATVTDDLGATATRNSMVTVVANQSPLAQLTVSPASGTVPMTVTASTARSSDSDGTIASSRIEWGDGTSSSGTTATHVYNTPGSYSVSATVTDNRGATSSASASVTVKANQPPVAKLSVTPPGGIVPVTVTASTSGSTDPDGSIVSRRIYWGDGSSTTASSGSHRYATAGTYTVKATVTDDRGSTSSASATVTVTWGVNVTTPTNNMSTTSPVRVVATATSNVAIIAMKVYVDNIAVYSTSAAKMDIWLKMAPGTRRVVVQAWDGNGVIYKTVMYITVNSRAG